MSNSKRILVLGASGAMGQYLVPLLAKNGHQVDAVSLDAPAEDLPNIHYIQMNVKQSFQAFSALLDNHYDAIVDFMIYPSSELICYLPYLTSRTGHYIFFSSYRIYDDKECPVRETSPRLLDASDDVLLRNSDDYCIYKARGENVMRSLPRKNWTIVRPAITYSRMRYQLVTLEMHDTVGRAFRNKAVVLPEQARLVQGTMSWAGDVARLLAGLLFNDKALGETFTVSTSEHHTWQEVADIYHDLCGMKTVWVDMEDYLRIIYPEQFAPGVRWQLIYDRLFTRIMDNSKVLAATGITQESFHSLYDGLAYEIPRCPRDFPFRNNDRMDLYLKKNFGL